MKTKQVIIGVVLSLLLIGNLAVTKKYLLLKDAYQKAVKEKVWYCKEYHKLTCE